MDSVIGIFAALLLSLAPSEVAGGRLVKSLLEMRQEHVVIQAWDLSCGAAALATLLHYQHDDPVPERAIANALVQREEYLNNPEYIQRRGGFSLLDLKRYVDKRGYKGVGYGRLKLDDLIQRSPIMVPVKFNGYSHFVIFRGLYGNRVLLADPAWGNRTLRVREFAEAWIKHPGFGKVGFVVLRRDGNNLPNRLTPRPSEFLNLR